MTQSYTGHSRARMAGVLISVVALLAAVACGDDDDATNTASDGDASPATSATEADATPEDAAFEALVEAAQAEGEVVYYGSSAEEVMAGIAQAFEDEYGIKVTYQKIAAGPAKERLTQEADAGQIQADVQSGTVDVVWTEEMASAGHLAKIDPNEMPNAALLEPPFIGEYYVSSYIDPWGLVYNTNELSADDLPDRYVELVDVPELQGRIVAPDPKMGGGYNNFYYSLVNEAGESEIEEWVKRFVSFDPMLFTESMAGPLNLVVSGEMLAAMPVQSGLVPPLKEAGAPVDIDTTIEPQGGYQAGIVVLADGPNPNAGKLFADFMLSEEAGEIACGAGNCAVPHHDIAGANEMPETVLSYDESFDIIPVAQDYLVPLFEAERG